MRFKDKILTEMIINNDRIVIAKNNSSHIIKYAPEDKDNFEKKANRVKLGSLNSTIEWLCDNYGGEIRDKLNNLQEAPNLQFKDVLNPTYPRIRKRNKKRCKTGGILNNRQLSLLDEI